MAEMKSPDSVFSPDELTRYARQMVLADVGVDGQARLRGGGILVVGAGGLGSAALLYLAAAGVGRLEIVDSDIVEIGNLHRQVIHDTPSVGKRKADSAARRLNALNPHIAPICVTARFKEDNAESLAAGYDLLVDATDNLETRFLINRVCVRQAKPMVYGSVLRFEGQMGVFDTRHGACFRCMVPEIPAEGSVPKPSEAGVFGPLPGIIGTLQALAALKLLLDIGERESGRITIFDGRRMAFEEMRVSKRPGCPECGQTVSQSS